ncbi:MAG: hypothetical protein ACLSAP_03950 [Oscillospiraceae bacterium]
MRIELKIGLLLYAVALALRCFTGIPEFAMGLLLGLAVCFEVVGVLPENAYRKMKRFKKKLLKLG